MKVLLFTLVLCPATVILFGQPVSREIKIKKGQTYLNLPISNSGKLVRARIKYDGTALDQFTIKLAEANPDYWAFFDVTGYQGKSIFMEIENYIRPNFGGGQAVTPEVDVSVAPSRKGLDLVFADSKFPGQDSVYRERDRPQVHFSSRRGWINDPNGLVYYNGEYHLYYQHNPYGWEWGNMHWGHAVAKDLLHWEELKEAIFPVLDIKPEGNRGDAAFSGSAVVDPMNTSGFRKNGINPLIAFYTSTGRGECIKISYDNGRTFIDYTGNPILKHDGRDPKVFWYAPGNHWVMVVWDSGMPKKMSLGQEASLRQHSICTSPDLKTWTYQSGVGGFFECPELFELPVEGQPGVSKWIMYDAHGRYAVGGFDGEQFTVGQPYKKYDNGGGYFYASQTYNNTPDNRRIQIGWGRNITHPGMPFNQAMLFPTELKLKNTFDGLRLCPTPIKEISTLHKNSQTVEDKVVTSDAPVTLAVNKESAIHVVAEFEMGDAPITLNVLGYELNYDNEWEFSTVAAAGTAAPITPAGPFTLPTTLVPVTYVKSGTDMFKIEAIVDKNIIEFYVNDGELYYATLFSGKKTGKVGASVRTGGGGGGGRGIKRKYIVKKMEVHELKSVWPES